MLNINFMMGQHAFCSQVFICCVHGAEPHPCIASCLKSCLL